MKKWRVVEPFLMSDVQEYVVPTKDQYDVIRQNVGDFIYEAENVERLIVGGRSFYGTFSKAFRARCQLVEVLPEDEIGNILGGSAPDVTGFTLNATMYEGNNTPYSASVDKYGFMDAAGMPTGANTDVIFRADVGLSAFANNGCKVNIIYAVDTVVSSKTVDWRLDYVVHRDGEAYDGGTTYVQFVLMNVNMSAKELAAFQLHLVPSAQLPNDTVEVEFRLTRRGTSVNDTCGSDIGVKHAVLTT